MHLRWYNCDPNRKIVQKILALESLRRKNGKIEKIKKTMPKKTLAKIRSTLLKFQKDRKYCDITMISADGANRCVSNAMNKFRKIN